MTKWGLFQVCKASPIFAISLIHYINRLNNKNDIDQCKEAYHKIQQPFMIKKKLSNVGIKGVMDGIMSS